MQTFAAMHGVDGFGELRELEDWWIRGVFTDLLRVSDIKWYQELHAACHYTGVGV